MEGVIQVVAACLRLMKWRLRSPCMRRLQTDMLALCSGVRPVIMVDYGGKMPELKDQLCALLRLCHKRGEKSEISNQYQGGGGMEGVIQVVAACLRLMKWRLRSPCMRRLQTDMLALCSGVRPVIMVDYGGKMPELKHQLCALLRLCHKESSIFKHLRVMVIEDMIYLIHVEGLAELVKSTLNSEVELHFVDIEQDPPKMITKTENSSLGNELIAVQELFALAFPNDAADRDYLQCQTTDTVTTSESSTNASEFIDLSSCIQDALVTVPTLNGWLLGYPVVYLFSRERISDAIYNLSTQSLRIYRIMVTRNENSMKGSQEELMSFSVPCNLSVQGSDEAWATTFMTTMQAKLDKSRQFWVSMKLEVSSCYPQSVVL